MNYSPGRASELRSQETNTTGSSSLALLPTDCDRDDEHNGGLGSVPTRADFGAMSPGAWVQPVPWEEPGGDSLLSAVIKLVQPTEWFRDCKSRSDGYVSTVLLQRALARDGFVKLEGKHIHMDMDMQSSLCSVPISPRDLP